VVQITLVLLSPEDTSRMNFLIVVLYKNLDDWKRPQSKNFRQKKEKAGPAVLPSLFICL
jgi:hypothetical protein